MSGKPQKQAMSSNPFFSALQAHAELPLVFQTGNTRVNQGYHITEIKKTRVSSLDCGRGTDEWDELVIQILDGSPASNAGFMSTGKFLGITSTATRSEADQKLYFEFSPGNGPLLKMSANEVTMDNGEAIVHLDAMAAECKPMTRFIAAGRKGCCC